jgi:hypothetical protein
MITQRVSGNLAAEIECAAYYRGDGRITARFFRNHPFSLLGCHAVHVVAAFQATP